MWTRDGGSYASRLVRRARMLSSQRIGVARRQSSIAVGIFSDRAILSMRVRPRSSATLMMHAGFGHAEPE